MFLHYETVTVFFFTFITDITDSGLLVQHEKNVCVPVNIGKALYLQLMHTVFPYISIFINLYILAIYIDDVSL